MLDFDTARMLLGLPALVVAIVCHEYAHAQVATWLGDDTPAMQGRLSLNPLVHLDLLGAIALFLVGFGWAKPVQINIGAFRHRKRDEILVALAGPFANLIMAFIATAILVIGSQVFGHHFDRAWFTMLQLMVMYNIGFAIFNLLPIPPLDGATIITAFLPWNLRMRLRNFTWVSLIVLLVIANTPILTLIFRPVQR
ncbi:MAG: site-2 protease family protein, partial [Enterococcus sp.]|nr:site-2 protease family protein [Enterococcus sp.]